MNVNNVVLKESELIRRYVDERQIPGACFSVVTPKEIAYSSYGNKALVPEEEATRTTRSVRDQRNSMISSFACPGLTRGAKRLSIPVLITCF